MTAVTFRTPGGESIVVDVAAGTSVMRAAVDNGIDGIIGECGGSLMCATCHVYVADDNPVELPPMSSDEDGMLDFAAAPRDKTSRLSCQLTVPAGETGYIVTIPKAQA